MLVDRLWPRGVSRAEARFDLWLKDIGPSNELRQWFGHDPASFPEFRTRYLAELSANPSLAQLQALVREHPTVTLLYGAKDPVHNQAVVLRDLLAT